MKKFESRLIFARAMDKSRQKSLFDSQTHSVYSSLTPVFNLACYVSLCKDIPKPISQLRLDYDTTTPLDCDESDRNYDIQNVVAATTRIVLLLSDYDN